MNIFSPSLYPWNHASNYLLALFCPHSLSSFCSYFIHSTKSKLRNNLNFFKMRKSFRCFHPHRMKWIEAHLLLFMQRFRRLGLFGIASSQPLCGKTANGCRSWSLPGLVEGRQSRSFPCPLYFSWSRKRFASGIHCTLPACSLKCDGLIRRRTVGQQGTLSRSRGGAGWFGPETGWPPPQRCLASRSLSALVSCRILVL